MADVQSNIIQSLTKMFDSGQTQHAARGLPERALNKALPQPLTFSVVSVKNTQILLQDQSSGKKFLLEKSALQAPINVTAEASSAGTITSNSLTKGDTLVLISTSQKYATFVIEKSPQLLAQKLNANVLQNVAVALNVPWPDAPTSLLKKAPPAILNQLHIATNTQQAGNLANAIVAIISAKDQANLPVKAIADAAFIKLPLQGAGLRVVDPSIADVLRLNVRVSSNTSVPIDIPLVGKGNALSSATLRDLNNLSAGGKTLNLQFDLNNKQQILTNIEVKRTVMQTGGEPPHSALDKKVLAQINALLLDKFTVIKQSLSSLLVSPHSPNLHKGIAILASKQNLGILGGVVKQHLTRGVSPSVLQNASILITQNPQNVNQIQVNLLAKPITVNIANDTLSNTSIDARLHKNTTDKSSVTQDVNAKANTPLPVSPIKFSSASDVANHSVASHTQNVVSLSLKGSQPSGQLKSQLTALLALKGNSEALINAKISTLQATMSAELNQALPRAQSMTQTLPLLLQQLNTIGTQAGAELKQLISQVSLQISDNMRASELPLQISPFELTDESEEVIASQSSRQIRQMLSASALPNVAGLPLQQITGLNNQGGLVNGLVTMLQASLQAKLIAQQPQMLTALLQSSPLAQGLSGASVKGKANTNSAKLLQDLARLDPKSNLMSELNKVLSSHSLHKISGAETSLQSQDSFYYILPNMFSSEQKDIEIVIKREREQSNAKEPVTQQAWQLSMKLDVGKSGEVLAKVKLVNNKLDLNLYASNQLLKDKILTFLPLLNKRLVSLGLTVTPACYLGKIPKTLHNTNYQLVQTYV